MKKLNIKKLEDARGVINAVEKIVEVAVFATIYYFVWRYGYDEGLFPSYYGKGKYVLAGLYALLVLVLFEHTDGFKIGNLRRLEIAFAQWIALLLTNIITYFQLCLIANVMISPLPILMLYAVEGVVSTVFIFLYADIYYRIYVPHNMIMVYGNVKAASLKTKMDSRRDKYRIKQMISVNQGTEKICKEIVKYDSVVLNDLPAQARNDIVKFCYQNKIRVYIVPKISDILIRGASENTLFDTPIILLKGNGLSPHQRFFKRLMDVTLSLIALIVVFPFMLIVALAIKAEDGGPVFYKQKRVTLNGKEFEIIKFRSMIVDAEKLGVSQPAVDNDPRITKVGKVIRRIRVDELPQILNIIKGDMSIVGPRPERVEHMEKYISDMPEFEYRLKVKGGLTGYAQIYGKYNTNAYDKLRLDLIYIENYSLFLDVKLILMTLRIMLKKESTEGFDKVIEPEEILDKLSDTEDMN